jgi:hypothetical protein
MTTSKVYFAKQINGWWVIALSSSHTKYSTKVFKEVNGQKSLWRTCEVTRAVDRDPLMRGFIS